MIFLLRDPVERAYSHYQHEKRMFEIHSDKNEMPVYSEAVKILTFEEILNIEFTQLSFCQDQMKTWESLLNCLHAGPKNYIYPAAKMYFGQNWVFQHLVRGMV